MKRLVLSANAEPPRGGQGLNLQHMIEAFKDDFRMQVFCRATGRNGVPMHAIEGSRRAAWLGRVPLLRRLRDWQTWYNDVGFDRRVAQALPEADCFQGTTGQCLETMRVAKQRGCRTLLDVVTTHIDFFGEALDQESARFDVRPPLCQAMRERIKQEYQEADAIRVMSQVAKCTFTERGFADERIVVATPPFNVDEFPQAEFRDPVLRVCFVGLIEPWKGFHYLIDAFNAANIPDSELILWGGPGARPISRYLNEVSRRNPRIMVRPVEVRTYGYAAVYGQASVLVHPSLSDGFGYVVGEAMACGLPVIVTSCSGAADLVRDGVNGYIVPPRDVEAIADRLQFLAKNSERLRGLGAAARETVRSLTAEQFRTPLVATLK